MITRFRKLQSTYTFGHDGEPAKHTLRVIMVNTQDFEVRHEVELRDVSQEAVAEALAALANAVLGKEQQLELFDGEA